MEVALRDYGVASTRDDLIRLAVSPAGRRTAIDFPTLGWSGFGRLFSTTRGIPLPGEAFRTSHLFELDPQTKCSGECCSYLASRARAAAKATKVEQNEWWVTNEDGAIRTPSV